MKNWELLNQDETKVKGKHKLARRQLLDARQELVAVERKLVRMREEFDDLLEQPVCEVLWEEPEESDSLPNDGDEDNTEEEDEEEEDESDYTPEHAGSPRLGM